MIIGLRAHNTNIKDDIPKLANKIAGLGVQNIQFAISQSLPELTNNGELINFGMGNCVKREFDQKNIQIAVLSCYINMIHPDLTERTKMLDRFKQYLTCASSFGAQIVGSETGSVDPKFQYTTDNFQEEHVDEAVQSIRSLVQTAEKVGVFVGIEPGVNHPIHSLETMDYLVRKIQSPNLKFILDPVNLLSSENNDAISITEKAFQKFHNQIEVIHLKDVASIDGMNRTVNIGDGSIDFQNLLLLIKKNMPNGYVMLDEVADGGNDVSYETIDSLNKTTL